MTTIDEYLEMGRECGSHKQKQSRTLEPGEATEMLVWMRSQCDRPGDDWVSAHSVVVTDGKEITTHKHRHTIVLFYVEPAGTPVVIEDEPYLPEKGEVLILPPQVWHSVAMHHLEKPRISIAMKVA